MKKSAPQIDIDSIEAEHRNRYAQASENDYNHLSEIEGLRAQALKPEEQNDKSLKPHKIFKIIVIGDTGKYTLSVLAFKASESRAYLSGSCQTSSPVTMTSQLV